MSGGAKLSDLCRCAVSVDKELYSAFLPLSRCIDGYDGNWGGGGGEDGL